MCKTHSSPEKYRERASKSMNRSIDSGAFEQFLALICLLRSECQEHLLERTGFAALFAQVIGRADGDQTALVNDPDAIGQFLGHAELVGGKEHGHAGAGTFLQDVL